MIIEKMAENMPTRVRVHELMQEKYGNDESLWPTVTSLAAKLGIERKTVYLWLKGTVKSADLSVLDKWCEFFEVQPGDILVKDDEATS